MRLPSPDYLIPLDRALGSFAPEPNADQEKELMTVS